MSPVSRRQRHGAKTTGHKNRLPVLLGLVAQPDVGNSQFARQRGDQALDGEDQRAPNGSGCDRGVNYRQTGSPVRVDGTHCEPGGRSGPDIPQPRPLGIRDKLGLAVAKAVSPSGRARLERGAPDKIWSIYVGVFLPPDVAESRDAGPTALGLYVYRRLALVELKKNSHPQVHILRRLCLSPDFSPSLRFANELQCIVGF